MIRYAPLMTKCPPFRHIEQSIVQIRHLQFLAARICVVVLADYPHLCTHEFYSFIPVALYR